MDRTQEEVAQRALRLIGVCAADEPPSGDQMTAALDVLSGLWAEVRAETDATWDVVTGTPAEAYVPLANLLAAEMAGEYGVVAPMTVARARLRLLAVIRPWIGDDACRTRDDYGLQVPRC